MSHTDFNSILKTTRTIVEACADQHFEAYSYLVNLTEAMLKDKSRVKHVLLARYSFYFVGRHVYQHTYTELGRIISRDHASLVNGVTRFLNHARFHRGYERTFIRKMLDLYPEPLRLYDGMAAHKEPDVLHPYNFAGIPSELQVSYRKAARDYRKKERRSRLKAQKAILEYKSLASLINE